MFVSGARYTSTPAYCPDPLSEGLVPETSVWCGVPSLQASKTLTCVLLVSFYRENVHRRPRPHSWASPHPRRRPPSLPSTISLPRRRLLPCRSPALPYSILPSITTKKRRISTILCSQSRCSRACWPSRRRDTSTRWSPPQRSKTWKPLRSSL